MILVTFAKTQPGQHRNRLAEVQYGTDIAVLVTQWLMHVNFISGFDSRNGQCSRRQERTFLTELLELYIYINITHLIDLSNNILLYTS
jgi:hypothetical protein